MKSEGTTTIMKTGMYKLIGTLYIIAFATMNNSLCQPRNETPATISNEVFAIGCNVILLLMAVMAFVYVYVYVKRKK
ncbi:hypothetical protein AB832_07775 [Flavobacteriaceae bacterium (ex Bugula neritina AB1)]|nr:hypothetical protein AB832_07775 [Flavobacteriaceae bacterium (ex Bugula neritina AB1)]